MLQIGLSGEAAAALAAMPERLRQALSSKAATLAAALQAKIQQKLSGGVLNARTGALARSIVATIDDGETGVSVRVATADDIKYAAIHEFGGIIPPHQIVPDKAKALAFVIGGKQVFAARVNLPAIAMPERSFMRAALAEMADEIASGLTEAAMDIE
jgi:phage gpG-like protein